MFLLIFPERNMRKCKYPVLLKHMLYYYKQKQNI